jgi:hypothetical protein
MEVCTEISTEARPGVARLESLNAAFERVLCGAVSPKLQWRFQDARNARNTAKSGARSRERPWATKGKITGATFSKPVEAQIIPQLAPDLRHGARELSICLVRLWSSFDPISLFCASFPLFGNIYSVPLYLGSM